MADISSEIEAAELRGKQIRQLEDLEKVTAAIVRDQRGYETRLIKMEARLYVIGGAIAGALKLFGS